MGFRAGRAGVDSVAERQVPVGPGDIAERAVTGRGPWGNTPDDEATGPGPAGRSIDELRRRACLDSDDVNGNTFADTTGNAIETPR